MPIESTESAVQIELFCLRYGMLPPLRNGADRADLWLGGNIQKTERGHNSARRL
jgi:hypothetical protein